MVYPHYYAPIPYSVTNDLTDPTGNYKNPAYHFTGGLEWILYTADNLTAQYQVYNFDVGYVDHGTYSNSICTKEGLECTTRFTYGFAAAYGGTSNIQTKEIYLEETDASYPAYIYIKTGMAVHPIFLFSIIDRFRPRNTALTVNVRHKKFLGSASLSTNESLTIQHPLFWSGQPTSQYSQYSVSFQVKLASEGDASYRNINFDECLNNTNVNISFQSIVNAFGSESFFMGKECQIRIEQTLGSYTTTTIPQSFYYLPNLDVTRTALINPRCTGSNDGSVTVRVDNLPNTSSSFLYLVYQYGTTAGTSINNIHPEDRSISWNGKTLWFQTALRGGNSGEPIPGNTINITGLGKGVYKIKVYCLAEGKRYFPDSLIVELIDPPQLKNNSYASNNWNGFQVTTGANVGYITLNAEGGTPYYNSYSYSTDKGQSGTFIPVNAQKISVPIISEITNVFVTVKDYNNCSASKTIVLKKPPDLKIDSLRSTDLSCNSNDIGFTNNGSVEFNISGGVRRYYIKGSRTFNNTTYKFNYYIGDSTHFIRNTLQIGNYDVYLTDSSISDTTGLKVPRKTFTIGEPERLVINDITIPAILCSNDSAEAIIISSNNNISYRYKLGSNIKEQLNNTFTGLIPKATYIFDISRNNCYSQPVSKTMPKLPPPITITTLINRQASCANASNGSARIAIKGGTRNGTHYTITGLSDTLNWLNDSTFNYENRPYGNYTFSVKDFNQCIAQDSFKIDTITNRMEMLAPAATPVSCEARSNGSITASLDTSKKLAWPYTYEFRNTTTGTTDVRTGITVTNYTMGGLSEGNYLVKITDNDHCSSIKSVAVTVHPNTLTWGAKPYVTQNTSCPGISNGALTATASKGFVSPNYIYKLSRPGMDTMVVAATGSATFTGLAAAGNYVLKVTDDSACSVSQTITINANANPVAITVTEKKDQYCDEVTNGSIRVNAASAGHTISSLVLVHPGNSEELLAASNNAYRNNLPAGNYTVKAKDDQGCMANTPLTIGNLKNYPVARFLSIDSVACATAVNGKLKVTANQAYYAGNLTFRLGATTLSSPDRVVEFTGLGARTSPANKYVLRITDSIGCSKDTAFNFYPVAKPVSIAGYSFTPASCVKAANSAINLQAAGGKLPDPGYYFVLNGTDTLAGQTVTFTNQPVKGNNRVVLYDRYGCSASAGPFWFPVRSDSLNITTGTITNASCPGTSSGKVAVTALNGNPFTYGFMYKVYSMPSQTVVSQQKGLRSQILGGLAKGDYVIEVADKDNCAAMSPIVTISEPEPVELSITPGYVADKGASTGWANAVISKGNGKYHVEWYRGNTVNPGSLISTSVTGSTSAIASQPAGTYLVRVQDTALCNYWGTSWLSRTFVIAEPEKSLSLEATVKNVRCYGESNGEIELKPSGGWGNNYRFGTSPGNINLVSPVFTGYAAGSYTFYVKDTAGVVKSAGFSISQPQQLQAGIAATKDALCYGSADGEAELSITGGNGSYAVSTDAVNWSPGMKKTALTAGSYIIYVRDLLGCETNLTAHISQPDQLILTDTAVTNTQCLKNEGAIVISAGGGTPQYDYSWYNGADLIQQGGNRIENLYSGVYTLKITDAHGCELVSDLYVSDLTDLAIESVDTRPVSCWQGNDGYASVKVLKGTPPYSITWPGNTEGESVSNLRAGTYIVSVYDSEGCKVFNEFTITMPDSLWAQLTEFQPPLCKGIADGIIRVNAMGGTPGYTYAWSTGRKDNILRNADAGTYRLLITDAHNCQREFSFTLNYHETLKSDMPNDITLCRNASSPLSPGEYLFTQWRKDGKYFSSEPMIEVTEAGNYSVEFEDYRGCTGTDTIRVTQSEQLMEAQFLMASVISLADTVIIFEASQPVPDSIRIILPKGLNVVDSGQYYRYVTASDTGTFSIGLISYNGSCQDVITKQLTVVLPGDIMKSTGKFNRLIHSFTLKPNPNHGTFNLNILLNRQSDAIIRIVSFGTGNTVAIRKLSGGSTYDEIFNLSNLIPGTYLVNLQAGDEMQNLKMIVY